MSAISRWKMEHPFSVSKMDAPFLISLLESYDRHGVFLLFSYRYV